jgi:hypothetical protein
MRPAPAAVAAIAILLAGLAGGGVGGPAGAVAVAVIAAGLALVVVRMTIPPVERRPTPPRYGRPDPAGAFPRYRRLRSDLSWSRTSVRWYDSTVRPVLVRALRSVLAERHRLDLDTAPREACALLGAELWPLVDPAGTLPDRDDRVGVDTATLAALLDRLETLSLSAAPAAGQLRAEESR